MSLTSVSENSPRASISKLELLELLEERTARAQRVAIRQSLTEFARYAGYEPAAHHRLLIKELEALERGDTETLLVFMPPGSAKSTYVNFLFPTWFIARHSDQNVITASHSTELAERWGRKTRNLLNISSTVLGVSLAQDNQAAGRWATVDGGEYYAVGVGVGIAGFRADLGIVDDPIGSREDAESKRIRDRVWDWYTDDFTARQKPGARRVIMHTRWSDDDLAGRVVKQLDGLGRPYRLLSLPAEAGSHDPLGREPGEMLWDDPGGYDYGSVLRARKQDSDARTWASLYQQQPVPDTGDYFREDWFRPDERDFEDKAFRNTLRIFGASDYAVTDDGGDYTTHLVVGVDSDERLYLLDLWRGRTSSDVWVESWCDLVLKWKPIEWAEETGQIKAGVGPFLERRARERKAWCARSQFPTRGDKSVRAQSIRGRMAMQGLYVPAYAEWRADFESELLRFPAGVHDDQVDALGLIGQMLDRMKGKAKPPPPSQEKASGYRRAQRQEQSWRV